MRLLRAAHHKSICDRAAGSHVTRPLRRLVEIIGRNQATNTAAFRLLAIRNRRQLWYFPLPRGRHRPHKWLLPASPWVGVALISFLPVSTAP